jgi:hypothetical protein
MHDGGIVELYCKDQDSWRRFKTFKFRRVTVPFIATGYTSVHTLKPSDDYDRSEIHVLVMWNTDQTSTYLNVAGIREQNEFTPCSTQYILSPGPPMSYTVSHSKPFNYQPYNHCARSIQ